MIRARRLVQSLARRPQQLERDVERASVQHGRHHHAYGCHARRIGRRWRAHWARKAVAATSACASASTDCEGRARKVDSEPDSLALVY